MIKKPDVLSDEKIWAIDMAIDLKKQEDKEDVWWIERHYLEAQLDVCVKHYEPLIKELYEALKSLVEWLEDDEKMIGNVVTIKDNCHKTLAKVEK